MTPAEALFRHAAERPDEPWLFHREGWDWRWRSWAEVAERVRSEVEVLSSQLSGGRVAQAWRGDPESVVLDLAIQASGRIAPGGDRDELETAAAAVQALLVAPAPREVVVLGGSPEDRAERRMLAWATVAGAAVLLEPDPAARVATAAWARPTIFHGTAAELSALFRAAGPARTRLFRRPRRPFGRLHTLLLAGGPPSPAAELAAWRERGVAIVSLPP
jgi:hypothetical protein